MIAHAWQRGSDMGEHEHINKLSLDLLESSRVNNAGPDRIRSLFNGRAKQQQLQQKGERRGEERATVSVMGSGGVSKGGRAWAWGWGWGWGRGRAGLRTPERTETALEVVVPHYQGPPCRRGGPILSSAKVPGLVLELELELDARFRHPTRRGRKV
ncbi:hypothetical protein AXG93_2016s1450 [Marchantia polymorpha subsp. ruderalis]|uniref:Uncharacterized protein n=1 Tax=Marchantia polymorpha subsp. ruderalis TaxID=1480154 RepID=A0A176VVA8_MARPO|nr:hypothetical protein AXG93_2016s1450 [Marchantia polymorpha subsp. ruderalis]